MKLWVWELRDFALDMTSEELRWALGKSDLDKIRDECKSQWYGVGGPGKSLI